MTDDERYNEHGQDSWPPSPEERQHWQDMTPGTDDRDHYAPAEERCSFCGELRSPDQFEDGLRCKLCANDDE